MSYPTFDEIVRGLQAKPQQVAERYAPGGHVEGARYWALDPGRDDRKPGSFYVGIRGQWSGRWRDEVTQDMGDMLDLIQRSLRLDKKGAVEEAISFLGIASETPQARQLRLRQEARAEKAQKAEAEKDAEKRERRQRQAHATYLEAEADIAGTPVEWYLHGRAIRLADLGRTPRVLRYHPALRYYLVDKETGEVIEGEYPAMVAPIYGGHTGQGTPGFIGIHKTYLARGTGGRWGKAPVPKAKLIWGNKKGGYIRLWAGIGPRGGKGAALSAAPAGSRLYITEGIEDGLSVAVLDPARRVAAAIDLGNIREMRLPPQIAEVVLVADNDPKPEQTAQIDKAVAVFAAEGRKVSVWKNSYGGKDINDALVEAMRAEGVA